MIELKEISKTFVIEGAAVEAVRNVSLRVEKGDIFGIIGFSGAGKSTLVRCINLLERPDQGTVRVGGVELTALNEKALREERKKIGMIFQHFNLMASRTVFDNIAYPLKGSGLSKDQIRSKVLSLLELVDLKEKELAYPSQLSGGQKQRVAIARALANDPKVLLCDEATSALDPQTTASILALLRELNKKLGLTIVIITHEMGVIKEICNRVAVMEQGIVAEEGEVYQVFSSPIQRITKDFIDSTSNLNKIHTLIKEKSPVVAIKPGEKIIRLKYLKSSATQPVVSEISRKFAVNANIIFGNLEVVEGATIGGLVVILSGEPKNIEDALTYLRNHNVELEVILDGASH